VKKLFGRLLILGVLAGAAVAVISRLRDGVAAQDIVLLTFDDGSTRSFASNTPEGEELSDIAGKLVEMGL
jgi:hypothetical protein